ncbi:MAG: radical SAM protein [Kiritimatiellae bacterium]|nr:radical SAM protein [Kiritimatiellia bacterium]MDD5519810.1 radical SAM protein [Kiritimatiellia bacterium]
MNSKSQDKKKVLFVMFAPHPAFQAQIGVLSAFLENQGYNVRYLEITIYTDEYPNKHSELVEKVIIEFSPDLIGFSSYDMNYYHIVDCGIFVKSRFPHLKIIVGGHHASLAPEDYLKYDAFDYVCIGEGEYVLLDLLESSFNFQIISSIRGLCFRNSDGIITMNKPREPIVNLDDLPFADRSIDPSIKTSGHLYADYLPMLAGKGCPFNCSYCANEAVRKLYPDGNKYVRVRSPERVIEEIEYCKMNYKFSFIIFFDDIFAANLKWLDKFCAIYAKKFPDIPFHCLLRPEMAVNEETLIMLSKAGCVNIKIGMESGSEEYRMRMLKRNMTNKTILKAVSLIRKHKMDLQIFMMVGLPDESYLDMLKTLCLNLRIRADSVQTAIFYPFKNTPLYNYCAQHNLLNEERRKKMVVYTYDTCLNFPLIKRYLIILLKWINSSTPIFCRFHFSYVWLFLCAQYRSWFHKRIDYA